MKGFSVIRTAVGSTVVAGFIEKLRERGVRVIGVDPDPNAVGKELCDAFYPVPWGNDPQIIPALLDICRKEKVRTIISGPEEETIAIAEHRDDFEKLGTNIYLSDVETIRKTLDKVTFGEVLSTIGLQSPRRYALPSDLVVPYIVKPRLGRGSTNIRIVKDVVEDSTLDDAFVYQEYIEGTEYSVDCFFDMESNPLLLVPRVRVKTDSGVSTISRTVRHDDLAREAQHMARSFKFRGPLCIQAIEREGQRYYTDCNHRFGGASILSIEASERFLPNFISLCAGDTYRTGELAYVDGLTMRRYYAEIYGQV